MLSIVIPTYKRNKSICLNLNQLSSNLKNNKSTVVYVLDDDPHSNLGRNEIFKNSQFTYIKNEKRLGHDENIYKSLKIGSKHDYCWILGDSLTINFKFFEKISILCQRKLHEIICVNHIDRDLDLKTGLYSDNYHTNMSLLWHLTLTGSIIFKCSLINKKSAIKKHTHKNFPLTGILMQLMKNFGKKIMWVNDPVLISKKKYKSYWESNIIEVFCHDWICLIKNNTSLTNSAEISMLIKSHSKKTKFFSFKNILLLRAKNTTFSEDIKNNLPLIREASHINYFLILFAIYIPPLITRIFLNLSGSHVNEEA